jgi:hypothetical protein
LGITKLLIGRRGEIVVCGIEDYKYRDKKKGVVVEFEDSEKP